MSGPSDSPPEGALLGGRLDSIFAEVQKNLPSIDFEISDTSSDEELGVFQRSMEGGGRSVVAADATTDSWESLLHEDLWATTKSPAYRKVPLAQMQQERQQGLLASPTWSQEEEDDLEELWMSQMSDSSMPPQGTVRSEELTVECDVSSAVPGVPVSAWEVMEQELRRSTHRECDALLDIAGGLAKHMETPHNYTEHYNEAKVGKVLDNNHAEFNDNCISKENTSKECSRQNSVVSCVVVDKNLYKEKDFDASVDKEVLDTKPSNIQRYPKPANKSTNNSMDVIGRYFTQLGPTLEFQSLDNMNFENASLPSYSLISAPAPADRSPQPLITNESSDDKLSLIERLARLSVSQSGTALHNVDPQTGAIIPRAGNQKKDQKTASNQKQVQQKTSSSSTKTSKSKPEKREELCSGPGTVFLDLRHFDEEKRVQAESVEAVKRIMKIGQEDLSSDSEDSDQEEVLLWHSVRRQIKQGLLNASTKNVQQTHGSSLPGQAHMKAQRLARPLSTQSHSTESTVMTASTEKRPLPTQTTDSPQLTAGQQEKKLRDELKHQRESRLRLGERLEALRPTHSVTCKQAAGAATPTLFDVDSSYEPAPHTLPADLLQNVELALLKVRLSTSGEMIQHRGGNNKGLESACGLSASYTALLTWLLCLVPGPDSPEDPSMPPPPFCVLGLQQLYLDGQLSLYVAVSPRDQQADFTSKRKVARCDPVKAGTLFQQAVGKFLASNTLTSVCHWLEDLVPIPLTSNSHQQGFVYHPPLPTLTSKPLSTFISVNPDGEAARKIFGLSMGFFWQTLETSESLSEASVDLTESTAGVNAGCCNTQTTMSLLDSKVYRKPQSAMGILSRILQEGLDLAGVRLLYPTTALMELTCGPGGEPGADVSPVLAMAIRGAHARSLWLDTVGPADPTLARRTDPNSLCAMYGGASRHECFIFCPRNPTRVNTELARWFGGRVPASGVIDVGRNPTLSGSVRRTKKCVEKACHLWTDAPPAALTAVTYSDILLVISPFLPLCYLGLVITFCENRGYQLRGIRRLRLTPKRVCALGVNNAYASLFTFGGQDDRIQLNQAQDEDAVVMPPSTLLLLNKENALHAASSLQAHFMVQFTLRDLMDEVQQKFTCPLSAEFLFHHVPYSDNLLQSLGGDFSKVPECDVGSPPGYIAPQLYFHAEMEQLVLVVLSGSQRLASLGNTLARLLKERAAASPGSSMELVGMKWVGSLRVQPARELTPYEVGDKEWRPSIHKLTSEPAVAMLLRGFHAVQHAELTLGLVEKSAFKSTVQLDTLMAGSLDLTYSLTRQLFYERELFPDPQSRSLRCFLPPVRSGRQVLVEQPNSPQSSGKGVSMVEESILSSMRSGPQPITTLMVAKPDTVQRHLAKLLRRIAHEGFKIVAMHLQCLTKQQVEVISAEETRQNPGLLHLHQEYLMRRPSLVIVLLRENAVKKLLDVCGPCDPRVARRQGQHLWHALFGTDPVANGIHASTDYKLAVQELKVFFPEGLCCDTTPELDYLQIACRGTDSVVECGLRGSRTATIGLPSHTGAQANTADAAITVGTSTSRFPPLTSLTQTNLVVLKPCLLATTTTHHKHAPYVEILEHLVAVGFELVGLSMVCLTETQALNLLQLMETGSLEMMSELSGGPCLVVALQRDNAIMVFDSLLGSSFDKQSVYSKYNQKILRARSQPQACRLLAAFFDCLVPGAQAIIESSSGLQVTSIDTEVQTICTSHH